VKWHLVPNDGYIYSHLAYHLSEVQDYEGLQRLFEDQDWMNARVPADGWVYDGSLADMALAWEMADENVTADEAYLADCFRYALIRTSINSLAGNYVPELVVAAVKIGLWKPERALSVAEKMPSKEQACKLFSLLLATDRLSDAQRTGMGIKALDTALAIGDEGWGARILSQLMPALQLNKTTVLLHSKDCLHWIETMDRKGFLDISSTFLPTLPLQAETFNRIARSIADISTTWKWL
jgi:hypothetical protein